MFHLVGEDIDKDFEEDEDDQDYWGKIENEGGRCPNYDRNMRDNGTFVGLEKEILESHSFVIFVLDEIVKKRNARERNKVEEH